MSDLDDKDHDPLSAMNQHMKDYMEEGGRPTIRIIDTGASWTQVARMLRGQLLVFKCRKQNQGNTP